MRRAILLAALLLCIAAPVRAASVHADFNVDNTIDTGFASVLSGNGSATVSGGLGLIAVPLNADAAFWKYSTALSADNNWHIKVKSHFHGTGDNSAYTLAIVENVTAPVADNIPGYGIGSGSKMRINVQYNTAASPAYISIAYAAPGQIATYWKASDNTWSAANGAWIASFWSAGTDYLTEFDSSDNNAQWRITIRLASDNSILTQTTWRNFNSIDSTSTNRWLVVGDLLNDYCSPLLDTDYIYFDSSTAAPPGDPATVTALGQVNKVRVAWTAPNPAPEQLSGYKVYRSTDNVTYTLVATIADNTATAYTDQRAASTTLNTFFSSYGSPGTFVGLLRDTLYYYKVVAYNGGGDSPGAKTTSATTAIDNAYSGTIRAKMMCNLIMVSTDHIPASNPLKADIQEEHDFIRPKCDNVVTLFISRQVLGADNTGNTNIDNVLKYAQQLVRDYGYDIVTIPHNAWFPVNPTFSEGVATEMYRMQAAHDCTVVRFGKAPVASFGWAYNKTLMQKAIDLGYTILPHPVTEQKGVDDASIMGAPRNGYLASKRGIVMAGNGLADNTFMQPSALFALQWSPLHLNTAAVNGDNAIVGFIGDLTPDVFATQNQFRQVLEDSQVVTFNKGFPVTVYADPVWWTNTDHAGYVDGEHEPFYMWKRVLEWYYDRYHGMTDYYSASGYAAYLDNAVTAANPLPPYALLMYDEEQNSDGTSRANGTRGIRYDSKNYHMFTWHRVGTNGYVRPIQYVPFSLTYDEPGSADPNWTGTTHWSANTGILRDNTAVILKIKIVNGTDNYTVNGAEAGDNTAIIMSPTYSIVDTTHLVATWDVRSTDNATRLTTIEYAFQDNAFCWYHTNDVGGSTITGTGLLAANECASDPAAPGGGSGTTTSSRRRRIPIAPRFPTIPTF